MSLYKACLEFTPMLVDVYEKLRAKGESCEIVMISFDDDEEALRQFWEHTVRDSSSD